MDWLAKRRPDPEKGAKKLLTSGRVHIYLGCNEVPSCVNEAENSAFFLSWFSVSKFTSERKLPVFTNSQKDTSPVFFANFKCKPFCTF